MRGRRFFRPTLTLTQKGAEVRALADLEHKPWAAEDGEVWMAAFSLDDGLHGAREIELSVAPDIVVDLRRKGRKMAQPGDTIAAGAAARTSRFKDEGLVAVPGAESGSKPSSDDPAPSRRRPSASAELERLGARLATANHALEQERERRAALAKSLEDERTANRQLRTELGQARAELEVAATARAEASAVEAELDEVRAELREAQRRHESETQALTRRHEEATQAITGDHAALTEAHATLQDQLRQQTETLELTREALAAERAETGRLHNRLSKLQESLDRSAAAPRTAPPARASGTPAASSADATRSAETTPSAETTRSAEMTRVSRRATSPAAARGREADPTETQRFDVLGFDNELKTEPSRSARRAQRRAAPPAPDPAPWSPPASERLRPMNPSLRHRTWWLGRLVALIVLCGVIVAVYLVLHTTVLH